MLSSMTHDPYRRVRDLATDTDLFSLGNRLFGAEKRQLDLFPDKTYVNADKYTLAGRLQKDEEEAAISSSHRDRERDRERGGESVVLVTAANEDEWAHVADQLGLTMLDMLVELMAYELVVEQKKHLRSTQSVMGRIFKHQREKEKEKNKSTDKLENGKPQLTILHTIGEEQEEEMAREIERDMQREGDGDEEGKERGQEGEGEQPVSVPVSASVSGEDRATRAKREREQRDADRREKKERRKEKRDKLRSGSMASDSEQDSDNSFSLPSLSLSHSFSQGVSAVGLANTRSASMGVEEVHLPPIS